MVMQRMAAPGRSDPIAIFILVVSMILCGLRAEIRALRDAACSKQCVLTLKVGIVTVLFIACRLNFNSIIARIHIDYLTGRFHVRPSDWNSHRQMLYMTEQCQLIWENISVRNNSRAKQVHRECNSDRFKSTLFSKCTVGAVSGKAASLCSGS